MGAGLLSVGWWLDSGLRRNDEVGGRGCPWLGGWMGVASPLAAPLDSGLRRNDGGGGRAVRVLTGAFGE